MDPILSLSPRVLQQKQVVKSKSSKTNKIWKPSLSPLPESDVALRFERSAPFISASVSGSGSSIIDCTPDSNLISELDQHHRRILDSNDLPTKLNQYHRMVSKAYGQENARDIRQNVKKTMRQASQKDRQDPKWIDEWNAKIDEYSYETLDVKKTEKNYPGVPNFKRIHLLVYPEKENPMDCALNAGICGKGKSTHDTDQVLVLLKFLKWQRRVSDEWDILPDFNFNSSDFDPSHGEHHLQNLHKKLDEFLANHISDDMLKKTFILLCECGLCGDGKNLFSTDNRWGHRTLLIFKYKDGRMTGTVEYYDSLGDWALSADASLRDAGVAMSLHFLKWYVNPLVSGQLLRMPSLSSDSTHSRRTRLYVQHPTEYMCQNWVPFFADARMAGIPPELLQRWFTTYQPYANDKQDTPPFGTDFALMVTLHLFHIRRWVYLYFDEFNAANGNVFPASYRIFGPEWGQLDGLHAHHFYSLFGCPASKVNQFTLTKVPWLSWLSDLAKKAKDPRAYWPFPTDSMATILFDPLFPLLHFANSLKSEFPALRFHCLNRMVIQ